MPCTTANAAGVITVRILAMHVHELMQLATGYWRTAALSAAVELGVFDALAASPADAATLASRCEADCAYTADLLDALVGLNLLTKADDTYAIEPSLVDLLSPTGATPMLGALVYNAQLYPLWGRLGDCVREGLPAVPPNDHLGDDPDATRGFVMGMHSRALGLATTIHSGIDATAHTKLLDVGSGPGTFSRLLAEQHAALSLTQFDLPAVIDVARQLTADSPATDRISFTPGDYRKDDLPTGHDALLYCGALHQETDRSAAALFAKFVTSVEPGGSVYVIDLMTTDGSHPVFSALFSLNMKLFNANAGVFTTGRTGELLANAGFDAITENQLGDSPYFCVRGKRP